VLLLVPAVLVGAGGSVWRPLDHRGEWPRDVVERG
jgi:hypothetical protein